jgi:homocysteine S-methyltransferase
VVPLHRAAAAPSRISPAYTRVEELLAGQRCVVLDGGMATELEEVGTPGYELRDDAVWGTWALLNAPEGVLRVHRRYVEVGCNVISTDTWGLQGAMSGEGDPPAAPSADWMALARQGIRLARKATADLGRSRDCAVAFSLHGDVADEQGIERLELLRRVFEEEPPDVVLLETMSLIDDLTVRGVQTMVDSGLPVWLSFRRCRHGLCGVFGQHWGGPEGDLFGRAARRFEDMGVGALLINCIPPDHVEGMLPWLRDFTDLPLGVYPNLGYYTESGWAFDRRIASSDYAELAAAWREEGAQIVGGCCGVGPRQIAAARARLEGTLPGRGSARHGPVHSLREGRDGEQASLEPWQDEQGRPLYPLPVPELLVEPGVFVPTQGSFLAWKHLFMHGIGAGKRCLDVGCGTGLLAVQLALNGAAHVHAVDIDARAVANTLSNAFRNGVADRVSGQSVDLYPWDPDERYDVVVASLYHLPNDPVEQLASHRPLDYWGRSLLDHLFTLLPRLLEPDGRAFAMQLSILSQQETLGQLERHGLHAQVIDFGFFEFNDLFRRHAGQIQRVEELSDAHHLRFGDTDVTAAYLLEITLKGSRPRPRWLAADGSRQTRRSPLHELARQAGARFVVRDGWEVASTYGSATAEIAACRAAVGMADCSHMGKLELRGPADALAECLERHAGLPLMPGFAGEEDGTWWCPLTADRALVLVTRSDVGALQDVLRSELGAAGATVDDVTATFAAVALTGPAVDDMAVPLADIGVGQDVLPQRAFVEGTIAGVEAIVLRERPDRLLVLCESARAERLWRSLSDAGRPLGAAHVGVDALHRLDAVPNA